MAETLHVFKNLSEEQEARTHVVGATPERKDGGRRFRGAVL
jgi:hypothetical protein